MQQKNDSPKPCSYIIWDQGTSNRMVAQWYVGSLCYDRSGSPRFESRLWGRNPYRSAPLLWWRTGFGLPRYRLKPPLNCFCSNPWKGTSRAVPEQEQLAVLRNSEGLARRTRRKRRNWRTVDYSVGKHIGDMLIQCGLVRSVARCSSIHIRAKNDTPSTSHLGCAVYTKMTASLVSRAILLVLRGVQQEQRKEVEEYMATAQPLPITAICRTSCNHCSHAHMHPSAQHASQPVSRSLPQRRGSALCRRTNACACGARRAPNQPMDRAPRSSTSQTSLKSRTNHTPTCKVCSQELPEWCCGGALQRTSKAESRRRWGIVEEEMLRAAHCSQRSCCSAGALRAVHRTAALSRRPLPQPQDIRLALDAPFPLGIGTCCMLRMSSRSPHPHPTFPKPPLPLILSLLTSKPRTLRHQKL